MTVRVLGAISLTHEGEPKNLAKASRTLLAVLVAAGPDGLTDGQIADEIWGDDLAPTWNQSLRSRMARLRKSLGFDSVRNQGQHYSLAIATDQVDAWQLLEYATIDFDTISDGRLQSLIADQPYPEALDSRLVATAVDAIEAARVGLLDSLRTTHPHRITALTLAATAALSRATSNEDLARASIQAYHDAGSSLVAIELADQAIERFEAELGFSPESLVRLRTAMVADTSRHGGVTPHGGATPHGGVPATIPASPPIWIGARPDQRQLPRVERPTLLTEAIDQLATRPIAITGESGSGKTQLAQRLATTRHGDGNHIVWVVAPRDGSSAYGPFLAAVPAWSDDIGADDTSATDTTSSASSSLDGSLDGEIDPAVAEARRNTSFVRRLHQACPDRPITIVVDDAHWLDSHSARLVDFLSKTSDDRLELIIVGRHDDASTNWDQAIDGFIRSGGAAIEVGPFSHDELVSLVAAINPAATSRQRNELANHLIGLRADLPLVANDLIVSADPDTLALPALERGSTRWTGVVWTDAVSERTRTIAAAAALSGVTWTFGDVLELTGIDPEDLIEAADELEDAGLLISEARPDQYSFRHALIHDAFASSGPTGERRKIHQRAADLADRTNRVHDKARHLLAVGPSADLTALTSALIDSATAHLSHRSWLEAVAAFADADSLGIDLGAHTLGAYAYAIERSGGDPGAIRQRAIGAALRADDHATMLAIVLDGVDSGELLEADNARLDLLDSISHVRLSSSDQRRVDLARCRELGIAGRHTEARTLHAEMTRAGDDVDTWLAIWTSLVGTPVSTWPPGPPAVDDTTDPISRSRVRNTRCERALATGDRAEFDHELGLLADEPASADHPKRRWALLLLQALQAQIDGDFTNATNLANDGLDVGKQFGLAGAFPAWSAQVFAAHWTRGRHGDLLPLLDAAAPDVRDSLLATAAYATALLEHDERRDQGLTIIDQVFDRFDGTTHAAQTPIAALLSTHAHQLADQHRHRIRQLLEAHRGSAVILGAGVAHLGPATHSLANVADTDTERAALLTTAVDEADNWHLPIWSVRCRFLLHHHTGNAETLRQAHSLAAGTELESLLDP